MKRKLTKKTFGARLKWLLEEMQFLAPPHTGFTSQKAENVLSTQPDVFRRRCLTFNVRNVWKPRVARTCVFDEINTFPEEILKVFLTWIRCESLMTAPLIWCTRSTCANTETVKNTVCYVAYMKIKRTENTDSCGKAIRVRISSFGSPYVAPSRRMQAAFAFPDAAQDNRKKQRIKVNPNDSMQKRKREMNSSGLAVWQSQQPQMAHEGSLMTVFMKSEGKLYA